MQFHEISIFEYFSKNLSWKFKIHWNRRRIKDTLHEDQHTFFIISRSVLLRMRNVSVKSCRENQNTHFILNNFFFFRTRVFYEIMWKNIVERGRPQMTIWRTRIASCIPKATNIHTHTGCVILIAFPLQQWLHERTSMLRYTYIACFVSVC
jgi:hypothetical protein